MKTNEDFKVIEKKLLRKYRFRFNEVKNNVEFALKNNSGFEIMNDYKLNSIFRELQQKSLPISVGQLKDLLSSDFSEKHNPFEFFLSSIEPWDNQTDHLNSLAMTVKTDNQDFWCESFKKWFISMVASMINPEVINHQCIVLVGPQGIGKSTWINKLVPVELKEYHYSGTIDPKNKDTLINLSECFIICLDELENLTKHESGSLKELITKTTIKIRRPYGKFNETLVRRASFIGSVNHLGFLNDPSGSRRYLCFEVQEIDYMTKINIHDSFSQAYSLYLKGEKYWFDGSEIETIHKNNQKFESISMEEELLLRYIKKSVKDNQGGLTTTEIMMILQEHEPNINNLSIKKLGEILRKHNFIRHKNTLTNLYVYAARPITEGSGNMVG
jgi:predicted P-loop ATPase